MKSLHSLPSSLFTERPFKALPNSCDQIFLADFAQLLVQYIKLLPAILDCQDNNRRLLKYVSC
jgi:hypothetical protein